MVTYQSMRDSEACHIDVRAICAMNAAFQNLESTSDCWRAEYRPERVYGLEIEDALFIFAQLEEVLYEIAY
jgi:hypothetical protein